VEGSTIPYVRLLVHVVRAKGRSSPGRCSRAEYGRDQDTLDQDVITSGSSGVATSRAARAVNLNIPSRGNHEE
jgi:hypothetical protein